MEGKRWLEKAFKNQALLINNQKETDQIQLKTITYQLTISQTNKKINRQKEYPLTLRMTIFLMC